jgi:hypothetical protein
MMIDIVPPKPGAEIDMISLWIIFGALFLFAAIVLTIIARRDRGKAE